MKSRHTTTIALLFVVSSLFTSLQAQEPAQKVVLLEHFTNTFCPNCIFNNEEFYDNVIFPYDNNELIHVSYHPGYPSAQDTFYQHNITENNERTAYYDFPGTPSVFLWGQQLPIASSGVIDAEQVIANFDTTSPIGITVTELQTDNIRTVNVELNTLASPPTDVLSLRLIVVEKQIVYTPPYDGMETMQLNVFRQTVSNTWDEAVYIAPPPPISVNFTSTYQLKDTWQAEEVFVVAFLQNDATKEVINAATSWGSVEIYQPAIDTTSVQVNDIQSNSQLAWLPNPISNQLQLNFDTVIEQARLQLYNTNGQLVKNKQVNNTKLEIIDCDNLSNGIYVLEIKMPNATSYYKIVKR